VLRRAITPRTRMISLCDPNNPTGVLMTPDRRATLAALPGTIAHQATHQATSPMKGRSITRTFSSHIHKHDFT
jgi:hypothetical protein